MLESVKGCFMKCGDCNNSIRVGCSYDVTKLQCPITGKVNGFFDECDITERQKLIWLLSGKNTDTPSDVELGIIQWRFRIMSDIVHCPRCGHHINFSE